MPTITEANAKSEFLNYLVRLNKYYAEKTGLSQEELLKQFTFSLLTAIDGESLSGVSCDVLPHDENGNPLPNIAGELHHEFNELVGE